jgi:uncharacterized delta-60 repeat protein
LDTTFNPGADNYVYSVAIQPDGRIVAGGNFTSLGGQARNRVGRLQPTGALDTTFNPGADATIWTTAVQADGRVLLGGSFTNLAGQSRNHLGRLNSDGSLDATFNPGANADVYTLTLLTDGKILAGGNFTSLGGQTRGYIGRLNADGSLDSAFTMAANSAVMVLAPQADGTILVGGMFSSLGVVNTVGVTRNRIGRIDLAESAAQHLGYDGSAITWLRGGTGPEAWRTTFEYSTNGVTWTSLGSGARISGGWRLAGVSPPASATVRARGFVTCGEVNGSSWFVETQAGSGPPTFVTQPASSTNDAGTRITLTLSATGLDPLRLQWHHDGSALLDATNTSLVLSNVFMPNAGNYWAVASNAFGMATSAVATLAIRDPAIALHPISQSRAVGECAMMSGMAVGTAPLSYQWHKNGFPLAGATNASLLLANLQGSDAGNYKMAATNQYGWAMSSEVQLAVNLATAESGFNLWTNAQAQCFALQTDGKILVGGKLDNVYSDIINRLNTDGTRDFTFYANASNWVYCLNVQSDGKVIVGGSFTNLAGQARNYIGRLNPDGTLDDAFNPGANNPVLCITMQADGKILVGGFFTNLAGQARNRIARLNPDGILDDAFNPGASGLGYYYSSSVFYGIVKCLAMQADGKILVGGYFTNLAGQARNNIGRLHPDGTLDEAFNPGANSIVHCIAIQADGKILVGGEFSSIGGQTRNYFARLNPDGTVDGSFNWNRYSYVHCIAVQTDGTIWTDAQLGTDPNCLAVQADGNILWGNYYRIGRLDATSPATQNLTFDGATLTWMRGGSSPEVWRTTFESSANGRDWIGLGAGTRISGGWQLSGISLPAGTAIRVRGYVSGSNGSEWLVETVTSPDIIMAQPIFGSGVLSVSIPTSTGQLYTLEYKNALTNGNWLSLPSVFGSGGRQILSDTNATVPQRFYRLRVN